MTILARWRALPPQSLSRLRLWIMAMGILILGAVVTNVPTLAAGFFLHAPAVPATLAGGFTRVTVVGAGLHNPVQTRFAPNGDMYIAEQCGTILLFHNGALSATPVIAIPNTQCDNERGLLGIDLDGAFATNGYLYAAYTNSDGYSRLSRFTVVSGVASPASETILYKFTQPSQIYHNIDGVWWGPDGKLWVPVGDGYTCGSSCGTNGQLLTSPHGKLLRFNPDGTAPADNPYPTAAAPQNYIWSMGYRSNFRMGFLTNGTPVVGDVGVHNSAEDKWQRFNLATKGSNFGWSSFEYHQPCAAPANLSNCPFYEYQNAPVGQNAVSGFDQYEGAAYPAIFKDKLFYSEYGTQTIHYLTFTDNTFTAVASDNILDSAAATTVDLETGPDGNLYSTAIYQNVIYKYVYTGPSNPTPVVPPLSVTNLIVKDPNATNVANWSIQSNLQVGAKQYGDQTYTLTSVPPSLLGDPWIQTANASNGATVNPLTNFSINEQATVYVAVDSRLPKPSWMDASWTNTGMTLTNNAAGGPFPQTIYSRPFAAGIVILGPTASAATTDLMYTVIVAPPSGSPPPPTFTPTPTPLPGGVVTFSNLTVADTANAGSWSLATNLQVGDVQYGDRAYTFTGVPSQLLGQNWIRTANGSKTFTGNPTVTFSIDQQATIYVAIDNRLPKPAWMDATWVNTGLTLTNTEATPPFPQTLFAKVFPAGSVSLGPVSSNASNTYLMYSVIAVPTGGSPTPTPTAVVSPTATPTATSTATPGPSPTPTVTPLPSPTPTATPTPPPGGAQLSGLTVADATNAKYWSLQTNLQVGAVQYGDRGYTLATVPASLAGSAWIRASMASKAYVGSPLVSVTINQAATVYVAMDVRVKTLPSWLDSTWTLTALTLTDSQAAGSNSYVLYAKVFPAGTVTLGPNDSGSTGVNQYTVIVQ